MNPPDALSQGERVFDEPWQAQISLTLSLNENGLFSWAEWAEALSEALQGAVADGSDYYQRWLVALESVLIGKSVMTETEVAGVTAAWHRAAWATPHGAPILIENDPVGRDRCLAVSDPA